MKDKLNEKILNELSAFKRLYYVEQEGERAAKRDDIQPFLPVELLDHAHYEVVLKELRTELVIFIGSFYFYSIIKRWVTNTD